ncbi:MAG: hypothetical protein L0Z62_26740, partial [Gemmataceae bacterium]|nr:hypothetical protein [Gemmataceae bacterium]
STNPVVDDIPESWPEGVTLLLTVLVLPGPVPAAVRTRRALKALLRAFGLRLLDLRDAPPEPPAKDGQKPQGRQNRR